jgi:hypothetical protein
LGPNGGIHASGIVTADFPITPTASQSVPGGQGDGFVVRFRPVP